MEKQTLNLDTLLAVLSPRQIVRIIDDSESGDNMLLYKGKAVSAYRDIKNKDVSVKHISPELSKDGSGEYIMSIYIYG